MTEKNRSRVLNRSPPLGRQKLRKRFLNYYLRDPYCVYINQINDLFYSQKHIEIYKKSITIKVFIMRRPGSEFGIKVKSCLWNFVVKTTEAQAIHQCFSILWLVGYGIVGTWLQRFLETLAYWMSQHLFGAKKATRLQSFRFYIVGIRMT